jgi:sugar O-acyltransferase (sialic acid O-acetyltransferase NeuD family)
MADLVIVGAGDHARVALETARALGMAVRAVVEPAPSRRTERELAGAPVVGELDIVAAGDVRFVVAIGQNRARADLFARALALGGQAATLVHPTAVLLEGATVGAGSHVCAAAVVGLDARVGDDVIVNTGATLDHDNEIGDHAFIAPGVHFAGRVVVGEGAHVGIGSTAIEHRRIGAWALVAAGATVISDVAPGARVAGVPARPMSEGGGESEA